MIQITNVESQAGTSPTDSEIPEKSLPISSVSLNSMSNADLTLILRFFDLLAKWEQRGRGGN